MAKKSGLFSRIRKTVTQTGKQAKFAAVRFGADLSSFVPAPASLLKRLGIRKAYVPAGVRPSVRSTIVTAGMLSKARLETEEGRTLSRTEARQIRSGRRYTAAYLKQKLQHDPTLDDSSLRHPVANWNPAETFQQNWGRDQRRFLRLAQDRTGVRYQLTKTGEWTKTEIPGAPRKVMNDDDWAFYMRHYHANETYYAEIGSELLELPPGEVSPRTIRSSAAGGRANRTGRSQGSYRATRRRAA